MCKKKQRLFAILICVFVVFFVGCNVTTEPEVPESTPTADHEIAENSIVLGELSKNDNYVVGRGFSEVVRVFNCNNPLQRNDTLTEVKAVERSVEWYIAGQVGAEVEASVIAAGTSVQTAIETGYTIQVSDNLQRSRTIDLPVNANSAVEYIIEWKPIVWSGLLPFKHSSGESFIEYTYVRIAFGEVIDFVDKTAENCGPSAASTASESENIEVPTPSSNENVAAPIPTESTIISSSGSYSQSDIDALIGAGNWVCIPGWGSGISIKNLPTNFEVKYPIIRIDNKQGFYYPGNIVPDGGLATGWLDGPLPNNPCETQQRNIAREEVDALVGIGNWRCQSQTPNGISIWNVPQNFVVQFPLSSVDKLDNRYYLGDVVPSNDLATGWLQGEILRDECP